MSEIDRLEQEFLNDYHRVAEKDQKDGKDINRLAYNELKRAKYFFEYLRTSEKFY